MDTLLQNSLLEKIIPLGKKRNSDIFLKKKNQNFFEMEEKYLDPPV